MKEPNHTISKVRCAVRHPGRTWIHGILVGMILLAMALTGPRPGYAALAEGLYLADSSANPGTIYHLESDGSLSPAEETTGKT